MAGYVCPCCGEISDIFSKGGGEKMAKEEGVGFLGRVPIDTKLVELLDAVAKGAIKTEGLEEVQIDAEKAVEKGAEDGQAAKEMDAKVQAFPLLDRYMETASSKIWRDITTDIVAQIQKRGEESAMARGAK